MDRHARPGEPPGCSPHVCEGSLDKSLAGFSLEGGPDKRAKDEAARAVDRRRRKQAAAVATEAWIDLTVTAPPVEAPPFFGATLEGVERAALPRAGGGWQRDNI